MLCSVQVSSSNDSEEPSPSNSQNESESSASAPASALPAGDVAATNEVEEDKPGQKSVRN